MSRQGTRIPGAQRSLNGLSALEIEVGNVRAIHLQAALVTNQAYWLWYRLEYEQLPDTTIPTADGFLTHGGSVDIESADPTKMAYLYLLVTDNAGTVQNGGALDYALLTRDL